MTGIVNGLERDGLVRRRRHGRDKRSVNIEATGAGCRLLDRARARRIDHVVSRLDDLADDELELLARAAELLDERFSL
jgi:DNA-binding MarR family transcriptional regulator